MVDRGGDIGFDMITVFFKLIKQGGASATPLTTLSLNSFAITGKTIAIFNTLNVLRQEKLYDGIWRYFDSRRGGENHQIAWEDAKAEMGFAVGPELIKAKFLSGSGVSQDTKADVLGKISLQFAALWNTWGQKTDAFGIKPEFKEKFAGEISSIISTGLNSSQLTQSQPKSFLDKAAVEIARLKNLLASLVDQINFKAAAGGLVELLSSEETVINNLSSAATAGSSLGLAQTGVTVLKEQIDALSQKVIEVLPPKPTPSPSTPLKTFGALEDAGLDLGWF